MILVGDPRLQQRVAQRLVARGRDQAGGLAIHERHLVCAGEGDHEHVRDLDEIAVTALEILALVLELDLRERLLDDRDELLGPERLEHEGERARSKRADRRVDAREPREEQDLGERRHGAEGGDEVDPARIRELHVDDRDVEAAGRHRERRGAALGGLDRDPMDPGGDHGP